MKNLSSNRRAQPPRKRNENIYCAKKISFFSVIWLSPLWCCVVGEERGFSICCSCSAPPPCRSFVYRTSKLTRVEAFVGKLSQPEISRRSGRPAKCGFRGFFRSIIVSGKSSFIHFQLTSIRPPNELIDARAARTKRSML